LGAIATAIRSTRLGVRDDARYTLAQLVAAVRATGADPPALGTRVGAVLVAVRNAEALVKRAHHIVRRTPRGVISYADQVDDTRLERLATLIRKIILRERAKKK